MKLLIKTKNNNNGFVSNEIQIGIKNKSSHKNTAFLFMIGGSGASVIHSFLSMFAENFSVTGFRLLPVFIDRNLDSANVSGGIQSVEQYRNVSRYLSIETEVLSPYLFIDDNTLFSGNNQLNLILGKIDSSDLVIFSYSVNNRRNINIKSGIVDRINKHVKCRILNMIFLPYFKLDDTEFTNDAENEIFEAADFIKDKLALSSNFSDQENISYVGVNNVSIYKKSEFQRNPFHIVSLIHAYSIYYFTKNIIKLDDKHYWEFYAEENIFSENGIGNLIPFSNLRKILIKNDFRQLSWQLLLDEGYLLKMGYYLDDNILFNISMWLKESTVLMNELGDCMIHKEICIYFRKNNVYDFEHPWKNLHRHIMGMDIQLNKKTFINEIINLIDKNKINTGNMVMHEVLVAIDKFIDKHWQEISMLYF